MGFPCRGVCRRSCLHSDARGDGGGYGTVKPPTPVASAGATATHSGMPELPWRWRRRPTSSALPVRCCCWIAARATLLLRILAIDFEPPGLFSVVVTLPCRSHSCAHRARSLILHSVAMFAPRGRLTACREDGALHGPGRKCHIMPQDAVQSPPACALCLSKGMQRWLLPQKRRFAPFK